ncbi:MAG: Transcription antitermination protein NusB [Mycoplasmataceae bacterium]|nr:MAG: Transcription antitermination protein NusB [Mycoplasmataceae bacterium]
MKSLKLLKRSKILILYRYFLLDENDKEFNIFLELYLNSGENENKNSKDLEWFNDFKIEKNKIFNIINSNLKEGWKIERIPILEKAILSNAAYEINSFKEEKKINFFSIIEQSVSFSKKYLESDKHKYINKVLDEISKEKMKELKISNSKDEKPSSI